jgi:hypothetical protein
MANRAWLAGLAGADVTSAPGAAGGGSRADDDAASLPRIAEPGKGLISSVCEPYMGAYVKFERQTLETNVAQAMLEVRCRVRGLRASKCPHHASMHVPPPPPFIACFF